MARTLTGVTYDTGALLAAERGDRTFWASHRAAERERRPITVPAVALGQAWRGGPQPLLSRLLRACEIEPLTEDAARAAGRLLARTGTSDLVDAAVAESACRRGDSVVTSDADDLVALVSADGRPARVVQV